MTKTFSPDLQGFPKFIPMGLDGFLVSFSGSLSDAANKAAIGFHAHLEKQSIPHLLETSVSLASVYLRFDPLRTSPADLVRQLDPLIAEVDWYQAALPEDRKLWIIPATFDPSVAVQIEEAAALAGVSVSDGIKELTGTRLRVLALGFAPGQPYLGTLPDHWNLPRQTALTKKIPAGAIAVAVRQFVLFTSDAPTGWRHVGQTAFKNFRPDQDNPFALTPGDEVQFRPVDVDEFETLKAEDKTGMGGATSRPIA